MVKSVYPEFTGLLVSLLDPFLGKGSPFWVHLNTSLRQPAPGFTRLSSLGMTYLGLSNSDRVVDPR